MPANSTQHSRQHRRELERRARQRRLVKLQEMRAAHTVLQRAVLVVHTLGDQGWERFLNADALRFRRFLELNQQVIALQREQFQLRQLLQEHQLATRVLKQLLEQEPTDEWAQHVARWNRIARDHYKLWTLEMCRNEINAALREVHAYQWSTNKRTIGVSIFGWHHSQRAVPARSAFEFEFSKTFRGLEMMDYVNALWDVFTDPPTFADIIVGHRALSAHEVLQQLDPNTVITRVARRFTNLSIHVHDVYLLFRVRTEGGFIQCARTIQCPELVQVIAEPRDVWPVNFFWFRWERVTSTSEGYTMHMGGSMGGTDANYANSWMVELFKSVLRSERLATGRQLITSA